MSLDDLREPIKKKKKIRKIFLEEFRRLFLYSLYRNLSDEKKNSGEKQ